MKLNIYEKKKVVKTYTEETYRIEWGVMCDVAEALNLDDMKDGSDVTERTQRPGRCVDKTQTPVRAESFLSKSLGQ